MKRETYKSYQDKLTDCRWRDFCHAVFRDRKFGSIPKCELCGASGNSQVHHLGYVEHREPWEYAFDEVIVLCKACHSEIHAHADDVWNEILKCKNKWVIYECAKAVQQTLERHETNRLKEAAE